MHSRYPKILAFVLLLALYGCFLAVKMPLPAAMDLPREVTNGRLVVQGHYDILTKNVYSYVEPNQDFPDHHWLSCVAFYLLQLWLDWTGLGVFKLVLLFAAFALLFHTALKSAGFWWTALFSIPTILIMDERTELRPEIFSYFLVTVFLWLLTDAQAHPEKNWLYCLIPLQVLWVNMHIFFPLGILFTGGLLVDRLILGRKQPNNRLLLKKLVWLLVGLVLAIFVNPFGVWQLFSATRHNMSKDFPISSAEVVALSQVIRNGFNLPAMVYLPAGIVLGVSLLLAFWFKWKRKPAPAKPASNKAAAPPPQPSSNLVFYSLAGASSFCLGLMVVRGMPLFALMFLPAMAACYVEIWPALRDGLKHISPNYERQLGPVWVGVFILGTASLIAFTKPEELGVGLTASANKSAEFFKDNHLKGPILNDTDIGSYLIYELYPGEQVFTDNRFGDAYSRSFFADVYLPMFRDESKWPVAFKKYNFNTLFFYHYDDLEGLRGFMFNRIYDRTWAWVYADQYAVIFVRNTPENADVIKKYQITPDNFLERMKALSDSSDARDELAAADLFNLAGRTDLSMPIYWKYVSLWPDNGKVWFCMGKTELTIVDRAKANPYLAALYLERAIKEGWKTWQTYSFLSLAYFRTGQIERARETLKEENSIDPNSTYIQEDVASLSKMYGVTTPIKLDTPGALLKTP